MVCVCKNGNWEREGNFSLSVDERSKCVIPFIDFCSFTRFT